MHDFGSLIKQKDTQNLFAILETNDKYGNFNYTVYRWSYDVLLIKENNFWINLRLDNAKTNTYLYFCYFYYSLHWFSDTSSSFSSSSVSCSYSISSSSSPSTSRKLYILLVMFYCQNRLCCNYNCLHPTTLIKIELFYIYFSRILDAGAEEHLRVEEHTETFEKWQ